MDEVRAGSQMRDLCREVIEALQQVFGNYAKGYVIGVVVEAPYPSVELDFELYGYFPVKFGYDRGIFGFAIGFQQAVHIPLPMRDDSDLEEEGAVVRLIESLRDAVLLRIPDKYLESIGARDGLGA